MDNDSANREGSDPIFGGNVRDFWNGRLGFNPRTAARMESGLLGDILALGASVASLLGPPTHRHPDASSRDLPGRFFGVDTRSNYQSDLVCSSYGGKKVDGTPASSCSEQSRCAN
jgi:hypothetical protein